MIYSVLLLRAILENSGAAVIDYPRVELPEFCQAETGNRINEWARSFRDSGSSVQRWSICGSHAKACCNTFVAYFQLRPVKLYPKKHFSRIVACP